MLTNKRYDVVTADVIHPIFAGSGNLYSAEYFALIRRVLNPGGMVVQWTAGTDAEYKIIARTFLSVFPQTTVWADGSLLVGMVEPLKLSRVDFERKLRMAGSAQGLRDFGVDTWDRLLSAYVAGPEELRAFVGGGPILTDDKPLVEYFFPCRATAMIDTSSLNGRRQALRGRTLTREMRLAKCRNATMPLNARSTAAAIPRTWGDRRA
jgi:spermidine synthase